MINPLNELSDIYLGSISEADNSPEAIKGRVMQHVRAIRYRARKEGDQLTKAYNDYMAGQAGISATEKSMVKERLGMTGGAQHQEGMAYGLSKGTGKPSGAMAAFGKKKPMVKVKLNPSKKIGVKVTDIGPGGKEVVRKNTMDEAKVDKSMIFGKDAARNERRFGKKGHFDPDGSGVVKAHQKEHNLQ